LARSVPGRFNNFHAVMARELLDHIDYLELAVARLDDQVDALMVPFVDARDRLDTIPGIAKRCAEIVIAEIGVDMGPVPYTRAPGVMGRAVSGQQRISRQTQIDHDQIREPVAHLCARRGRLGGNPHQGLLPRRAVPTHPQTTR
jgi:hypothetical protein